jgi:TATA-box binding protein (TBP) (component of TFIID and TFIIIB)
VIKSVAVGSASVAPEIVRIGTQIFVCVGFHVRVGSIASWIFVSGIVVCLGTFVGVGIKSTRPKIIDIRLKNGGIINCIVIRDGKIVVVGAREKMLAKESGLY